MKKIIQHLVTISACVFALSACASFRAPVTGWLYSEVTYPIVATGQEAGNRIGKACASSFLYTIAKGDSSIEAARRNGSITTIVSADETFENVLFLYSKSCTIVRGR